MVFGREIVVKLPKNDLDTRYILSLRYSKWDANQFCWIVPNYGENLEFLKSYFKNRITELVVPEEFETNTGANVEICPPPIKYLFIRIIVYLPPNKFFTLFLHQPEKVLLNCKLIGNRVKITNCRATVSNLRFLPTNIHCLE